MMRGSGVLTADRAWPGHGLWLKGTDRGCRGWFCWAGPSLQCYCCCCCWCCCSCLGWVEPLGVATGQQVARTGREVQAELQLSFTKSSYSWFRHILVLRRAHRTITWLQLPLLAGVVDCGHTSVFDCSLTPCIMEFHYLVYHLCSLLD